MTVILVAARRPTLVPIEAVGLLGGDVQYTEELPAAAYESLPSARSVLFYANVSLKRLNLTLKILAMIAAH